jgi:Flp pilus assembly protein TadD
MGGSKNPLENIIYISLPETVRRDIGAFTIDPAILLPVEVPEDNPEWNLKNLSWEMILAGLLRVISREKEHPNAEYFRNFSKAIKPDIVRTIYTSALVKANNGDFDLAEEFFTIAGGLEPDNQNVPLNLALMYERRSEKYATLQNKEFEDFYKNKAKGIYESLAASPLPDPEVFLRYGSFLLRSGESGKGLEYLRTYKESGASKEDIESLSGIIQRLEAQIYQNNLFHTAFELIKSGKEIEGIENIREFLKSRPDDWNAWFLLGWGLRRINDFEMALEAFSRSVQTKPDEPDALNELAICQMELGRYEDCEKTLHQALAIEPENIKLLSNLGILHLKLNRTAAAHRIFESVAEKDPEDPIAKKYLQYLE